MRLSDILEAAALERIRLVKLSQETVPSTRSDDWLRPARGEKFLARKILLQGSRTGTNYVYAESVIALDRVRLAFAAACPNADLFASLPAALMPSGP